MDIVRGIGWREEERVDIVRGICWRGEEVYGEKRGCYSMEGGGI